MTRLERKTLVGYSKLRRQKADSIQAERGLEMVYSKDEGTK